MTTYISMLRGVNVSGQKKINMADLKKIYEDFNFQNIRTYIQSGNVVFESESALATEFPAQIQSKIRELYGFEVPIIQRTAQELKEIVAANLFAKKMNMEIDRLHITFLTTLPHIDQVNKLELLDFQDDEFEIMGKEIYLYCPNGYGNTKLSNTFFETKLKVSATTRNWKTINELLKMAGE